MTAATPRIATLDFLRGLAVMGILLANLPAFGLPEAAYFSPLAWGGSDGLDRAVWFVNFVAVEGKMRGLFSLLFGASMLLVIDRAGDRAAPVHFARMAVLFALGCLHLYLIWWGDILAHYALVGAAAFLFVRLGTRWLVALALMFTLADMLLGAGGAVALFDSAGRATPQAREVWNAFAASFGVPPRADLLAEIAAFRGSFADALAWRWNHAMSPFAFALVLGPQTLGAMLLGMAGYRSGFLTGAWSRAAYRRTALICLGIALPAYAALGLDTIAHGFDQRRVYLASIVITAPFRLLATVGYAALFILLLRPGGAITARIVAVGRAAFTNYLGTSVLMLLLFTGLHQFARLSRAELYLVAPAVWTVMLLWSKPWLDRFAYGPLEWLWRSVARAEVQSMRRTERS
ncbi:DUF418 domain-containing protein [Sphingomonas sp. SUN019]|uniref:DUF418 domain-containing protein n=1 Tax=Sphingomonas sp. SUN019 TaxID=2937788 RepID=UPI002164A777|nr:DUF418 domain-containing protein [Sphingomonas sp. SUN019]UVO49780.1 DUF418 domain-containing protein [Sphingomonas sp. SUN019]